MAAASVILRTFSHTTTAAAVVSPRIIVEDPPTKAAPFPPDSVDFGTTTDKLNALVQRCLSLSISAGTHLAHEDGNGYIITKEEGGVTEIHTTYKARQVGEGGFSTLFHLFSITHQHPSYVYKIAKDPNAADVFTPQYIKLINIAARRGKVPGLPSPPILVKPLSREAASLKPTGILTRACRTDLYQAMRQEPDFNNIEPSYQLVFNQMVGRGFYQLLMGLHCLREDGILHGDIKPGNILVSKSSEGFWDFELHDFDHAKYMRYITGTRKFPITPELIPDAAMEDTIGAPGTKPYICSSDLRAIHNAALQEDRETYIDAQHARDLFALGVSLIFFASRGRAHPYSYTTKGLCDSSQPNTSLADTLREYKFSERFIALLIKMINPLFTNRGVTETLLVELKDVIRSDYPETAKNLGFTAASSALMPPPSFVPRMYAAPAAATPATTRTDTLTPPTTQISVKLSPHRTPGSPTHAKKPATLPPPVYAPTAELTGSPAQAAAAAVAALATTDASTPRTQILSPLRSIRSPAKSAFASPSKKVDTSPKRKDNSPQDLQDPPVLKRIRARGIPNEPLKFD